MKKELIMNLLVSAGANIEAALSLLEEEKDGQNGEQCAHPKDSRRDMSTMGWDRWECKDCGHVHEKKLNKEVDG